LSKRYLGVIHINLEEIKMTSINKISMMLGLVSMVSCLGAVAATTQQNIALNTSLSANNQAQVSAANTKEMQTTTDTKIVSNTASALDTAQNDTQSSSETGANPQLSSETEVRPEQEEARVMTSDESAQTAGAVKGLMTSSSDLSQKTTGSVGDGNTNTSTVLTQLTSSDLNADAGSLLSPVSLSPSDTASPQKNGSASDDVQLADSSAIVSNVAQSTDLSQNLGQSAALFDLSNRVVTNTSQSISHNISGAIGNGVSAVSEQALQQQVAGQLSSVVTEQIASTLALQTTNQVSNSVANSMNLGL
jgi:hypothetical protein